MVKKSDDLLQAMRHNPAGDWTIDDVKKLAAHRGWQCLPPSGGSHWKIVAPGRPEIITVPARRPIKPIYIRKLVALAIEEKKNEQGD